MDIIIELKSTKFSLKIYLILGFNFDYYRSDKVIKKEMFIHNIYEKVMLSSKTDEVINEIFQSIKDKYDDLDKQN